MEHLFMQIFDRRDWIAGQLRQQGESFSQSMASNLLAAGGRLPPWLWTAAAGSDCWDYRCPLEQELNREQIISGILNTLPHVSTPTSPTIFSGKPLQKDINVPQSKGSVTEKCVTTPFSVPHCHCADNGHQDRAMDSFDEIQESRLVRGDKGVNLGKKGNLTDGLTKQRGVTEYTGRITRSRATAMNSSHVKDSLDLKHLSKFPVEFDDNVTQLSPAVQQLDSFEKPSNVTSSKRRVSDPQKLSCSVQAVNIQKDTYYNVNFETGAQMCSSVDLEPSSGAAPVSLPPSSLDITNSAASLPPSGNNNPAQPCHSGVVNNEHKDAYSSELFSNISEVFGTSPGNENQCTSSKLGNSRLEPLESLFGEPVSQDSEKTDRSLLGGKLTSDSVAADCNSPSELSIVDNIICTLPHAATSVDAEPAQINIKDRASSEKLGVCMEIEHQHTSPEAVISKSDTALSTHRESSVCSCRGKDDSSMAAELQDKLHTAEAVDEEEDKADTAVYEGQEEKCIESLELEKPEIRNEIVSYNHNTSHSSSPSSMERLLGNSLAYTVSSEDGTLNCFPELSDHNACEQDDDRSSWIEIPPHLGTEGQDIETITAEATKGSSMLEIAKCNGGSETSSMFLEAEKAQDGAQKVAEGSASQQAMQSAIRVHKQRLKIHCCSRTPTPLKETALYNCEGDLEAKEFVPEKTLSTDKNYEQHGQTGYYLRSSSGHVNNSCKSNVSLLSSTYKHDHPSKAEEIETSVSLKVALVKSFADGKSALSTSEVCNTQLRGRYLLRSSTGPNKNEASSRFSGSNDSYGSRQSREAILETSELRYSKRRKVDDRHNNSFGSSPTLRCKSLHLDEDANVNELLSKGLGNCLGTCEPFQQSQILKEVEKELSHSCHKEPPECLHQSQKPQTSEDDFHLERNEPGISSSLLQHMQEDSFLDCNTGGQVDRYFTSSMDNLEINESAGPPLVLQEPVAENAPFMSDVPNTLINEHPETTCIEQIMKKAKSNDEVNESAGSPLVLKEPVAVEDAPNMPDIPNTLINEHLESTCSEQIMNKAKPNDDMECQLLLSSVAAPHPGDKDLVVPETIPEFEGFSIENPIMGNGFIFDDPNLQKLTRERASALEQLRRSMNIPTPFSRFSTKHRIHRVPDVCQSLPGELLKCMSLDDHLQSSGIDGNDQFYHSSPFSSAQFFHSITRGPFTPPVDQLPQKGFLERKGSGPDRIVSNPELTCFRIDEHARSLEDNTCREEYQDCPKEIIGSRERGFSSNRKALVDVTSIYQNAAAVGSSAQKNLHHSILGSVETKLSFSSGINDSKNAENGCGSHARSKVENKENDFLSASRNKVQKAVVPVHNRLSKASIRAAEQKRSQVTLVKKGSNIVSNISSFVPLVRQKQQAAAPVTGKRQIKVKSLMAAKAAKHETEKKEKERKMKKEAAMLVRMKLEKENTRKLEVKQKQKEEKKKDDEIAARKRQREEERKEKPRKRNCIEAAQHQRKDYEERVHAEAVEEKDCKRKVLPEETGMQHKAEKEQNIAELAKFVETEKNHTNMPKNFPNASNSLQSHGAPEDSKTSHKVIGSSSVLQQKVQDKNAILKENRQSQSYEISPYRDSDDEEGGEDKKHKKKFVPSWARRESLNEHLLSMRHLDPTKIFCRKRSFDLSEVLSFQTRQRVF